jgi:site-specific recombinase XerD
MTQAARDMFDARRQTVHSVWVFPNPDNATEHYRGTSLDHTHAVVRRELGMTREFVLHSLRHTMLTRLGESGADAFTVQRVAGHHSITMSQRYVHPSRGAIEASFERFEATPRGASEVPAKRVIRATVVPVLNGKCDVSCDSAEVTPS